MNENMKRLFISDLHPERGFNKALYRYLKDREKEYAIYFIGDSRMWPDHYRKVKHTPIIGNHELELRRVTDDMQEYVFLGNSIILCHGHNTEWQGQVPGRYVKDFADIAVNFWKGLTWKKRFPLGQYHNVKPVRFETTPDINQKDTARLLDLCQHLKPMAEERLTTTRNIVVLVGHHHEQYVFQTDIEGWTFVNCGAGWQGEHVTQEDDGQFYFHTFK